MKTADSRIVEAGDDAEVLDEYGGNDDNPTTATA